ncbi:MAG: ribosome silencing factor [Burkholderiales bacterium]
MNILKLQKAVIAALEDIKGHDIKVFDVTHLTSLFDRVIIASADSNRQVNALAGNVQEKAKAAGVRVYGSEGEESGEWVLVDLGDIVVHIMQPVVRSHYNLEELWGQPKPRRRRAPEKSIAEAKVAKAAKVAKVAKKRQ